MLDTILTVLRFIGIMFLVLLVFNFMILVHEWGHFLAARWRGLHVDRFYIWFGKPLWKRTYNGVEYGLGSIPLGGFVSLPQMSPMEAIEGSSEATENRRKYPPITPLDKIIVAFAGPLFSALLGLAFACIVCVVGKPTSLVEKSTTIGALVPGMPAEKSGLKLGDKILEIDGKEVDRFMGLKRSVTWAIASSPNPVIPFKVLREGETEPRIVQVSAPRENADEFRAWEAKPWYTKLFERAPMRKVGLMCEAPDQKLKEIMPNSPAAEAKLQPGDVITHINGVKNYNLNQLFLLVPAPAKAVAGETPSASGQPATPPAAPAPTPPIALTVKRGAETLQLTLQPRRPDEPKNHEKELTGIAEVEPLNPDERAYEWKGGNPFQLVGQALLSSVTTLKAVFNKESPISIQDMSGPVGIMNVYYGLMDNVFRHPDGWRLVIWFSVILNLSLAFMNMMPLPVFDGGHITLAILEAIRGKTVGIKIMTFVQTACVLMILSFMLIVTLKDAGHVARENAPEKTVEPKFLPRSADGTAAPAPAAN